MRLINTRTYALEEFHDGRIPPYAILSHTWETDEVLFADMKDLPTAQTKRGFLKIQNACAQAEKDHLSYVWVDTCCIDKSSSAELQEAINSMYEWYAKSEHCYVFLADILGSCPVLNNSGIMIAHHNHKLAFATILLPPNDEERFWHKAFSASTWFSRGWTLQELIAPKSLLFYSSTWKYVGERERLVDTISRATNIDSGVLSGKRVPSTFSVAQRMAWAAHRRTTRIEDQAYSLLGLFGVNMPMLYGEGKRAFIRLQEEIMKSHSDHTILVWEPEEYTANGVLLASSPADFAKCGGIVPWGRPESFEMTNRGLRISLPLLGIEDQHGPARIAFLNCQEENDKASFLALNVHQYNAENVFHLSVDLPIEPGRTRVRSVDAAAVLRAEKTRIEITRSLEQGMYRRALWLNLEGPDAAEVVEFSCSHGEWVIQDHAVVVEADTACHIRATALLKCGAGAEVLVMFGFESFSHQRTISDRDTLVLGVFLHQHIQDKFTFSKSSDYVHNNNHQCMGHWDHKIPNRAQLQVGERQAIAAEIAQRNVLGQDVIVCTVRTPLIEPNQPVEIYTTSSENHIAVSSPFTPGEDASMDGLSEQADSGVASAAPQFFRHLFGRRSKNKSTDIALPAAAWIEN